MSEHAQAEQALTYAQREGWIEEPDAAIPYALPLTYDESLALTFTGGRLDGVEIRIPLHDRARAIRWRRDLLESARGNKARQLALKALCSHPSAEGCLFWLSGFVRVYKQVRVDETGRQRGVVGAAVNTPFFPWPCQVQAVRDIIDAIEGGHDLVIDKSRQMGATVLITLVYLWYLLFRPNSNFQVLSMTEDLVDKADDPFSILKKLDFTISKIPRWLLPGLRRNRLLLSAPGQGSAIVGRSTTSRQGRAGALLSNLVDEMCNVDDQEAIWTGYAQSSPCRIGNSTPGGPTFYAELVRRGERGELKLLVLPWYNHPEKGRGRKMMRDPGTGELFVSNSFYERECSRAGGRHTKDIAQELDRKHEGAGATFFDIFHLERQIAGAVDPFFTGWLDLDESLDTSRDLLIEALCAEDLDVCRPAHVELTPARSSGASTGFQGWRFWLDLEPDENGVLRPPQNRTYAMGGDVGHGTAASNSTLSVFDVEAGAKVAEFKCATQNPHEFARTIAIAGLWFGGTLGAAYVVPEVNGGQGETVVIQLVKLGYPCLMKRQAGGPTGERTKEQYGWWSNRNGKNVQLQQYRHAVNVDEYANPSVEALEEAKRYVRYASGGIGPASMEKKSSDEQATHGDLVIADMLSWLGARTVGARSAQTVKKGAWGSPLRAKQEAGETEGLVERKVTPRARPAWRGRRG